MRPLLPLLAGCLALASGLASPSGADPASNCQKATAKGLSACLQKVGKAQVACFEKTGAACAPTEKKLASAFASLEKEVRGRCPDEAAVEAAGYAPLLPEELAERFEAACLREVGEISQRVFGGPAGPGLAAAGDADRKCLLRAGREAGKLLGKAVSAVGHCAGKSCDASDLDRTDEKLLQLEEKAARKIEKKCGDLAGLIGEDAEALARETSARTVGATAAPCDPIDAGYCLFPFPNDYFSAADLTSPTGRRIAFASQALPVNENLADGSFDPSKWNVLDGFSVGSALIVHDPELDLAMSGAAPITDLGASLEAEAPFLLLDAQTGARQLLWTERDAVGETADEQPIFARVGTNLENGRRYLAALRNLKDAGGAALETDPVFAAYRDRTPTRQLPVEARRRHMEQLFADLAGHGVARDEIQLAWDFTTQSTESSSRKLLAMRDDAFEILGDGAPGFTVDDLDEPFNDVFRRVQGTFQVPLYLTDGGVPGSPLRLGPDGLPVNEGDFFTASYNCVIPNSATTGGGPPAVPARITLYGHGLLGSDGEASTGHVRAFANAHNFVVCGTDWTGFSEEDEGFVLIVLQNFSNFPRFVERQHQGVLNFLVLARLMQHEDGFASHAAFQVGGQSVIDPSAVFYDGNSQGGILGGVLAAFAQEIERFVLGVPGINYSTLLDRSTDFARFAAILNGNGQVGGTYPERLDQVALIAVAQMLWDQTDPSGHVRHTTADTYPDTPPKKILYHVAFGDHQVAPVTVEVAARSNGAYLRTPAVDPAKPLPELVPYYGIPEIESYPFDGSAVVIWDSSNPAPPIENLPPPEILPTDPGWTDLSPCAQNWDSDPHECPRRAPEARLQKSEFLKIGGAVVDTCSGLPCLAPTF
jgi:hypothetical protein